MQNIYLISLTFARKSNGFHATVSMRTRFRSSGYEFEPQSLATFFTLIITAKSRYTAPLLCMQSFDTKILLKPGRVLLRGFSVLLDKKFVTENRDIPLLCIKCFDTRNFLKHTEGFPYEIFAEL